MFCSQCGVQLNENVSYCSLCGGKVAIENNAPTNEESESADFMRAKALFTPSAKQAKPPKKSGCLTVIAVFFGLIFLVSFFNGIARNFGQTPAESTPSNAEQEEVIAEPSAPKPETLLVALGLNEEQLSEGLLLMCPALEGSLKDSVLGIKTAGRIESLQGISDPYEAQEFIEDRDWPISVGQTKTLVEADAVISDAFQTALDTSSFEGVSDLKSNYAGLHNTFLSEYRQKALESCGLTKKYENFKLLIEETERVTALANNAPWYPKGFSPYSDGLTAWKWADRSCSYYSGRCSHMDVISSVGCPSLYVEVNFLDASKSVVDWTNDTARSLSSGQTAKLEFVSFDDSVRSSELVKISCY